MQTGTILKYLSFNLYGFVEAPDGTVIMVHSYQQAKMEGGAFVFYGHDEIRPIPEKGQCVVLEAVPGKVGTGGKAQWWFVMPKPPKPLARVNHASETLIDPSPSPQPPSPMPVPVRVRPSVDPKEWITVRVGKIRKEQTSYGKTEHHEEIRIPWSVFLKAQLTSLRKDEQLQVRCKLDEEEKPLAFEVRRA